MPSNCHLGEALIFYFHSKKTVVEAHRELRKFYENTALSETMCRDRFRGLKHGDFDSDDRPLEGRTKMHEDAELEALLERNHH